VLGIAIPMAAIVLWSRTTGREVERMRGGREDERTRGRREKDGIGAEVSGVQRSGGLCGARPALPQGGGSWF
jgi:hypothetical protein